MGNNNNLKVGAYPVFPFSWKILRFKVIFVIFSVIRVMCCVVKEGGVVWLKCKCYTSFCLIYILFFIIWKKWYFDISTVWTFKSYSHLLKSVNTVILCNIINIKKSPFYLDTIWNIIYSYDFKAVFSASLLQSSVSHDTSEIIIIYIFVCMYSCGQKFTYTLQNLQSVNYFTQIRGIIQNACYFFI